MVEVIEGGSLIEYDGDGYDVMELFRFDRWEKGKHQLLDTKNRVLVKKFGHSYMNLDFHSLSIDSKPSTDPIRDSFLGTNGQYYSFINHEKEFIHWWTDEFLPDLTKENFLRYAYDFILGYETIGYTRPRVIRDDKVSFINQHYDRMVLGFEHVSGIRQDIAMNALTTSSYENLNYYRVLLRNCDGFERFCNICSDHNHEIYPVIHLAIRNKEGDPSKVVRYNIEFIRTDAGYRLFHFEWAISDT
jgi:hypothetical protein